ncbi:MAG: GntR family transcriptional regulator, partial [Comamonadaceae bacterium]
MSATPFSDSPIPRYLQMADLLRQRIGRGVWAQGDRLPSLETLSAEFGVARVTMRQAIELLARDGLVSPQQGRGTFVTALPARDRWLGVVTTLDELSRMYRDTDPQIVNIDESTLPPALHEGEGRPAERYTFMRRVHSRDGQAYCVINIHLEQRIFRRSPRRFRSETVIPILTRMAGVTIAHAHQVMTIGTADMEVARPAGVRPPC